MKKLSQAEIVKTLTTRELLLNLYFSQILFIVLAIILSFILIEHPFNLINYMEWDLNEILKYGIIPGLFVVIIDVFMIKILPSKHYDDGGINERIFTTISIPQIFILSIVVSISEELLFRGVLQTSLGFVFASLLFAIVHVRYLNKIVLLVSVLLLSFLIGYLYKITGNLLVPITAHFTIDFLLGIYYRLIRSDFNERIINKEPG